MRPPVEYYRPKGQTKTAEAARKAAAHERARACLARLMGDLEGLDGEFIIEVLRAMVRAIGSALVLRADRGRAVGVLVGTLTEINPGWKAEAAHAHEAAEMVFKRVRA